MFINGERCVNKRNGKMGTVQRTVFDGSMWVRMDGDKEDVQLSSATVKRWYRKLEATPADVKPRVKSDLPPLPKGEKGIGAVLFEHLKNFTKKSIPECDELSYRLVPKSNCHVFKLNGSNIMEVTHSKYRLSLQVRTDDMTPEQLKHAYAIYGKERNWALATRYVFTSRDELPLLKAIILSAVYGKSRNKQ